MIFFQGVVRMLYFLSKTCRNFDLRVHFRRKGLWFEILPGLVVSSDSVIDYAEIGVLYAFGCMCLISLLIPDD